MKQFKKAISKIMIVIIVIINVGCFDFNGYAAVNRTLTLTQAVSLSMAESSDYQKIKSKILFKEVKYKEAVKSIQLKKKNMSTFRWSPLLSFKFPEKATLADESEFIYKPLQIQSEINVLNHQLKDIKYEVYEEISNLYTEIYTYQEKIKYKQVLCDRLKENLARNEAKLKIGEAKQSDVDKIQKSITQTESELAADMRTYEKAKSQLSEDTGIDVTYGYKFDNPYKDSRISRDYLENLVQYTLDNSQTYYEAQMTTKLALTALDTNYSLMRNQYGNKMGYISTYVTQAKSGEKVKSDAFKLAYDNFLSAIDSPWWGKKKILFIKIPREWFKGSIDGVRYVEDDPYLLYSNVLEYVEAKKDQDSLKKEITKNVEDGFENLVTAKNSYDSLAQQTTQAENEMEQAYLQNKAGELSFEEYEETRDNFETLQISEMEALELYTQLLYSYDRLTCGGVTYLLTNQENALSQGLQGESYITEDLTDSAYYYIVNLVDDNIFELGIHIPEDFETEVTHFELWVDGVQIGEKTEIDKRIRHLTLDLDSTEKVAIRVYNENKVISDCEITPAEYQGTLNIAEKTAAAEVANTEAETKTLGSYSYQLNKKLGMLQLDVFIKEEYDIVAYRFLDEQGNALYSEDPIDIGSSFMYLAILKNNLDQVKIELYGKENTVLYTGTLDTSTKEIRVN